ncbi:MAG: hypothetical protein FJ276_28675 [Planctomycetes bacterium]|nr:hypothetical protein [Planctomycetota bacterium]
MTTVAKGDAGPCRPEEILPDVRHEKFVQFLNEGRRLGAAYLLAGFRSASPGAARANACRLAARPEVAARRLHLRLKAASESGGPVSREVKVGILEALIRDASLPPSDRLRAIEAHSRFVEAEAAATAPPDPGAIAVWIMDETEARPPDHLRAVLAAVARVYRITPDVLADVAAGLGLMTTGQLGE